MLLMFHSRKKSAKDIFLYYVPHTQQTGLVQQTVQIVARFAHTI